MVKKNGKEKDHEEDDKKEDNKKEEDDQEEVFKEKEKVNPHFYLLFVETNTKLWELVFRREAPSQSGLLILMGTLTQNSQITKHKIEANILAPDPSGAYEQTGRLGG